MNMLQRRFAPVLSVMLLAGLLGPLLNVSKAAERPVPTSEAAQQFRESVEPFLARYCVGCHGEKKQNGDRRFDVLSPTITDDNSLVDFQDILDQLNLGEMPPSDAPQPTDAERQVVIRLLTSQIQQFHESSQATASQTVLRRLNSREYRNTISDLLRLDMTMFDPTTEFPQDQTTHQLDNVGETLVTSGYLLARYLDAADNVITKALHPLRKPTVEKWIFRDNFRQQPEIDQVHRKTTLFKHMTLYDVIGADKHEGAYGPILAFKKGVPYDGVYEVRLKAEAVNRLHPYDPEFLGTDPEEPLRLGIVAGDHLVGQLHKPQPIEPLLAEIELADEAQWYTVRVRLDKGYTPRFTFRNGLMDARTLWNRLLKKYPDQFPKPVRGGIVEHRYNAIAYGKLPQIHIHEIEISGPHFEQWPTASQRALLGEDCERILATGKLPQEQSRQLVERFLKRAYRRLPTEEEVSRILRIIATRETAAASPLDAFADGLKAALCSPSFLYLEAPAAVEEPTAAPQLTPSALASRLSYFLWSSTPDDQLLALARTGEMLQLETLAAQVDRLLTDKRSDAFINGFLDSWLGLRELGATPPDRNQFRDYYHYDLGPAMRQETFLFAQHLIEENLSVANFLDSDFTFVNKPLARLYGIEPPPGSYFEKVSLSNRRRGGLLGQASVLTVTANGIDTSPVVRGVWLLENVLGTPPTPPPPDVEPLDPDIRGAKTIRDQLEKHRSNASCYDCHRSIDPLGFAMENFDPIGRWRDRYNRRAAVDAAGELPTGESFEDIVGLKGILVARQDRFRRALAEKLLAYATGRKLVPGDRPHVDTILEQLDERGNGMRDLIHLVSQSEPFLSP